MNLGSNPEQQRLDEIDTAGKPWRRWGTYLSERQWGTVREDYSANGKAWDYLPHDHARSRAYRWGEDGIGGFSDDQQLLCLSVALWNGKDPILKERLFGLTNAQGNHGEDVKELYYYLDATPTCSYARMLYKYPHAAYPYQQLIDENAHRGRQSPEFELIDTGLFDDDRYFDVEIEYAKADVEDVLWRITVVNRGPVAARLHVLPQVWFRNTWTWFKDARKPSLAADGQSGVVISHAELGAYQLQFEGPRELLFCDNETNARRLFGERDATGFFKDAFDDYVVHGRADAVNPARTGTKAAGLYTVDVAAGGRAVIRVRLRVASARQRRYLDDARQLGVPVVRRLGPGLPLRRFGPDRSSPRQAPADPARARVVHASQRPVPRVRVELRRREPSRPCLGGAEDLSPRAAPGWPWRPRVSRARLSQADAQLHLVGQPARCPGPEHLPGWFPRARQHRRLRPLGPAADRWLHRPGRRHRLDGHVQPEPHADRSRAGRGRSRLRRHRHQVLRALPLHRPGHDQHRRRGHRALGRQGRVLLRRSVHAQRHREADAAALDGRVDPALRRRGPRGRPPRALARLSCAARLASRSSAPTGGARVALGRARPEGAAPLVAGPRVPHEEDPGPHARSRRVPLGLRRPGPFPTLSRASLRLRVGKPALPGDLHARRVGLRALRWQFELARADLDAGQLLVDREPPTLRRLLRAGLQGRVPDRLGEVAVARGGSQRAVPASPAYLRAGAGRRPAAFRRLSEDAEGSELPRSHPLLRVLPRRHRSRVGRVAPDGVDWTDRHRDRRAQVKGGSA